MAGEYILEMNKITKEYGSNAVLKDVTLRIRPGEIHALLGENGAGKSTLMNVLFGMPLFIPPGGFKGDVIVDGENVKSCRPWTRWRRASAWYTRVYGSFPGLP